MPPGLITISRKKKPYITAMPRRASSMRSGRCRVTAATPRSAAATAYDGRVSRSGSRWVSMSMYASATPTALRYQNDAISQLRPNRHRPRRKSPAVRASTSGYRTGMRAPQLRHRPRSSSQPAIGTLSRGRIASPQEMHLDRGRMIDSPRGSRQITTLRKEPTTAPNAAAMANSRACVTVTLPRLARQRLVTDLANVHDVNVVRLRHAQLGPGDAKRHIGQVERVAGDVERAGIQLAGHRDRVVPAVTSGGVHEGGEQRINGEIRIRIDALVLVDTTVGAAPVGVVDPGYDDPELVRFAVAGLNGHFREREA